MLTADSGSGWWSSDDAAVRDRSDAWVDALCASYRAWTLPKRVPEDFSARLRRFDLAGAGLIECVCSPCTGTRGSRQLRQDAEPYLGLQIVLSGRERFRAGDETLAVQAGDALVWRSDREMEFEVTEELHKVTLMLPLEMMRERLPNGAIIRPGLIDARRGVGALLHGQLALLRTQMQGFGPAQSLAVRRAILELMAPILSPTTASAGALSDQYLRNVQAYLLEHLRDEDLRLADAARANRISLRYLHMLFLRTGHSASAWVQEQRLNGCHADLGNPAMDACRISEIGWRWGFRDPSQFSRAFRARFGASPGGFRRDRPIAGSA